MSAAFHNEMLVANAGSGKTYALTTRIIRLLLADVPADRIAALTFTRKSAGEFLEELLLRLAEAAIDADELSRLAKDTGHADLTAGKCSQLLAHLIDHFGRLGLGTLDSFFARIARQFPLESGLPEDFAIADTARLSSARERALAVCFDRNMRQESGLQAMIEQCRQISRRQGERNVFQMLLGQIETLHQRFLETPRGCTWGDADAIWPGGSMPYANAPDLESAIDRFESVALSSHPDLNEDAVDNLKQGLDRLRALEPGQAWSKEVKAFVESKLSSEPKRGFVQLTKKKTGWLELTEEVRVARSALVGALYADIYQQILERSKGLYEFVGQYENVYAEAVRQAGLISFSDITTLLAERAAQADSIEALDWRAQVAYRIDQHFDHWLLDEFQDTSRVQWSILQTFIDEVVMEGAGQRSFFYVGDTKQAIYGWRGGDADLFREIYDFYGEGIQAAPPLANSWRSAPPVIEMVNSVFGAIGAVAEELKLPEETVFKWELGWNLHEVAEPLRSRPGFAVWKTVEAQDDDETDAQHMEIRRILEEVQPVEKGIECAVLLRKNKELSELAAYLQSHGIAVAVEGKSNPCTDNPLGSAVLAAMRMVAHPADTLSAAIARGMSCAQNWGIGNLDTFRANTLQSIAEDGFARTIQDWIERALEHPTKAHESRTPNPESRILNHEPFLKDRGEALIAAAEAFDAQRNASEGIDAFVAYIEALEAQEAEASDAVRLMTVHQAKGLGFEMVIVGGLDGPSQGSATDELVLGPDKKQPHWGILLPRKDIAKKDPVLGPQSARLTAEAKTDELCNAYVALTRAKKALYVVSNQLKEKSSASHFGRQLQLMLEDGWQAGEADWHKVT